MLFKLKIMLYLIFTLWSCDNFLNLQFICSMFCSNLWETLTIMKSILYVYKELAKKTVKAKINKAFLRIVLKTAAEQLFKLKFSLKMYTFPLDLQFLLLWKIFLRNHEIENIQRRPGIYFPGKFLRATFTLRRLLSKINSKLWRF